MSDDTLLHTLLAKDAIRDLVLRYCRAIDRRDYAALASLYHADATDDHGSMFNGPASEFVDWLPSMLNSMEATVHSVTNHLIEVTGTRAVGEVYCQAYHRYQGESGPEEMIIGGRYLDRYTQREGEWRFSHRQIVTDWNEVRPATSDFSSPMFAGTRQGAVFDQDPSRDLFD